MANYIDADRLRAEIKHLKIDVYDEAHQFDIGARSSLTFLESFIDSLQQEQPEVDLEMVVRIDNIVMTMLSEGYNSGYKTRPFYEEVVRRINARKEGK